MGSGCFKNIADIADFNFAHVASSKFAGSVGFASENKKEHEKQNPSVHFVQIMAKERTFLASKLQYASLFFNFNETFWPLTIYWRVQHNKQINARTF